MTGSLIWRLALPAKACARGGQRPVRLLGWADPGCGQLFAQVGGAVEANDGFAASLAAADLDHDGFADLAAGAPFEAVGSILDAGAVSVLYGSGGGLTGVGGQLFTQNTPGVGSSAEALDNFGLTLAAGVVGPATSSAAPLARQSRNLRTMPSG